MVAMTFFSLFLVVVCVWLFVRNFRLRGKLRLFEKVNRNTKNLWAVLDLNASRTVAASNALLDIVGVRVEDLPSQDPREVIHPDDLKLLDIALRTARDSNVFDRIRIRLRDIRYGWQWYENYGFFMKDGNRTLFCCSYFPINERMRIGEELRETRRRMEIMLNNSFNIVWTMDCSTRKLMLVTDVTRERFGVDDRRAGLIPSNAEFFPKEDILAFREMLNRRIEALLKKGNEAVRDEPQIFHVHVKNRDGSVVKFVTRSTLERNDAGQFILYGVSRVAQDGDEFH